MTDDSGAALPGSSIELRQRQPAAIVVATTTDHAGRYRLDVPGAGAYQIRFTLINFGSVIKDVAVADHALTVDAVLPLAFNAEVTVTGHRTFRNLADIAHPADGLIGLASTASEGAVTAQQLEYRPIVRAGDVLETVPGLVVSQHSGEGKANQYYLRGFNLDHGTDFAVSVAGIPVNMPSHGHGQSWSDVNFLIPELVSGVQFRKGPYYAEEGDFSTAGAAHINYVNVLDRPIVRVTTGAHGFRRLLGAASPRVAGGRLLLAVETGHHDGPWERPEDSRRVNGIVRHTRGDLQRSIALTAMAYRASWNAAHQIPRRAIASGLLTRFSALDASDGGRTHRYTLSAEVQRSTPTATTKWTAYAIHSALDLFSNFTFALNDPINADQFEQVDDRRVGGLRVTHRRRSQWHGMAVEHTLGGQLRHDWIDSLGLYQTRERRRLSTTREDTVRQLSSGWFYQAEVAIFDRLRASSGLRADLYRFAVHSSHPENSGRAIDGIVSPKFGVAFAPTRRLELYGNAGYGYHSNDARGVTIARDPLTGEPVNRVTPLAQTRGEELGMRAMLLPRLQSTVAVWGLRLDSELVFVGDAGTTEAGRPSRRVGIEWANYYQPLPWLTVDWDVSWSRARFTNGDGFGREVPGAVRRVASGGLSWNERARLSGAMRVRYVGSRFLTEDGSVSSKRSFLVNGESALQLRRSTRLVVDVLNLLNARDSDVEYFYRSRLPHEPTAGVEDIHTHPVLPRTVRLGLRFDF